MTPSIKALAELKTGDHLCWLYEREEDHRAVVSLFVRLGLERGEKVLYIADTHAPDTIHGYLRDDGLDVEAFLFRGQLAVVTSETVYLREGHFDPHALAARLRAETLQALDEGYSALRVTGETEWVLRAAPGSDRLLEYEVQLHDFFSSAPCLALCQFDQRRVDPSLLLEVLQAHPWVLLGQLAFHNPYHLPGKDLLTSRPTHTLRRWMMTLVDMAYASETLRKSEENYRRLFETMAQGVVYQAADGRILAANPAAERILGLSVEAMRGRDSRDPRWQAVREDGSPFPGDEHPAMVALRTGKPVEGVVMGVVNPKRNARVWLSVNAIPQFRPGETSPFQVFTTFADITERRLAEQRLHDSEAKFRALFEHAPDGILLIDAQTGNVVAFNRRAHETLGYTAEEFSKLTVADIDALETPGEVAAHMERIRRAGHDRFETKHRTKDGRLLDAMVSVGLLELGGKPFFALVLTDVTERKLAESERELAVKVLSLLNEADDSRSLLRSIAELVRRWFGCDAVGFRLREGEDFPYVETCGFPPEFVEAENRLCAVDACGQAQRDSQGDPVLECMCGNVLCGRFDPDKPFFTAGGAFWTNSTSELLASTTEADRQARMRNRCHGEGYESLALIPLRAAGEVFGLFQVNDRRKGRFTPRLIGLLERLAGSIALGLAHRRAEDALRESELRFRQLAENLPEMFWVVAPDWKAVEYINPVYEKVTGRSCESLQNNPSSWLQSVHPEDRQRVREAILAYDPHKGEPLVLPEARVVHLDGSVRWMRTRGFPVRNQEGRVYRVAGVSEDISEQKRAKEALRQRLAFERLVAEIGAELAAARGAAVDRAIRLALETLGQFSGVDRACVFEFREDGVRLVNTHQWIAAGCEPSTGSLHDASLDEDLPWFVQRIRNREVVYVPDVGALPPEADRDRQSLVARGVQSLIGVPMETGQRLIGALCLDCLQGRRTWTDEDQSLLHCVAQAIGGARVRALAEESLQRERDRAQHYLDTVEAIIVALDREGRITLINGKGCRLLGYREEELLGRDWFATCLPQPEGSQTLRPVFLSLLAGEMGPAEYLTNPVLTRDGQRREIAWHNSVLRDAAGRVVGTLSAGEDVTDRLRAEAELRESKQRLEMAVRAGNVGLWDWDLRTNRVYFSPEWKRQIGYEDHEIADDLSVWKSHVHPEDLDRCLAAIRRYLNRGTGDGRIEFRFRHKDGSYRWMLAQASLQRDEHGRPVRMLGSHTDITETKRLESELRESLRRQAEVEKLAATGRMAATVAHEINNPLAGIKNAFRLVREAVPPDHPDRDMADRMAREIDRIADIVRQMYEIYAPRTDRPTDVPLAATARDVAILVDHLCRERRVRISIGDIPADWTVHVHRGSLHQVLYNLVANGVHASPDGGVVRVDAEVDGRGWFVIHVRDQGPGIPAEVQKDLFQPFVSAPVGGRSKQGLGLGLAVVKSLVDSMGGRVEFETAAGQGTCFRVYLPRTGSANP